METNNTFGGKQILVFRSNINRSKKVKRVCYALLKMEGVHRAIVDLEDWENVLRMECDTKVRVSQIVDVIRQLGYECSELEDDI